MFIAIFADIATLAIAYDNAPYSKSPVKWNLPVMWGIAIIMGTILAIGSWICLTTIFVGMHQGIIEGKGTQDSVLFLQIVLTENWLIFITRAGRGQPFWSSTPSWQLVLAILLVDVLATLFCVFGWLNRQGSEGLVVSSPSTIVRVWVFSLGVFSAMAGVYYLLADSPAFDRLMHGHWPCRGRRTDRRQEIALEDLGELLGAVALEMEG